MPKSARPGNITLVPLPPYSPELDPIQMAGNTCAPTSSAASS